MAVFLFAGALVLLGSGAIALLCIVLFSDLE